MMQIIAFGILLYCGMEHFDVVIGAVDFVLGIVMPFLVGGAIAFVINVPMKSIERHLFAKNGKLAKWRRPVAYLLTLALVIGIITLALVVVIPELGNTISMIVQQVPVAVKAVQKWLTDLPDSYPALAPAVAELNIDWSSLADSIVTFVQNFAAGVVSSGVGIFSGIVSGVVTFVIAFTFFHLCAVPEGASGETGKTDSVRSLSGEGHGEDSLGGSSVQSGVFQFSVRAVRGGGDSRHLVCHYHVDSGDAVCDADRNRDCDNGADSDFRRIYRLCHRNASDRDGRSGAGGVVSGAVSGAAADRGKSDLPARGGKFRRTALHLGAGGSDRRRQHVRHPGYSGVHSALLRAVRTVCHVCEKKTAGTGGSREPLERAVRRRCGGRARG